MAASDEYMVADGPAWELIVADAELKKYESISAESVTG